MKRHASVQLRRLVDDAVGPDYDRVFLRLDLLATTKEARCPCSACAEFLTARRDELLATLPSLE